MSLASNSQEPASGSEHHLPPEGGGENVPDMPGEVQDIDVDDGGHVTGDLGDLHDDGGDILDDGGLARARRDAEAGGSGDHVRGCPRLERTRNLEEILAAIDRSKEMQPPHLSTPPEPNALDLIDAAISRGDASFIYRGERVLVVDDAKGWTYQWSHLVVYQDPTLEDKLKRAREDEPPF